MTYIILLVLIGTAIACLALNRVLPTRVLGLIAAAAALVSALVLLAQPVIASAVTIPAAVPLPWTTLEQATVVWDIASGESYTLLALTLLVGGALALLALALALAPTVRGFGGLFAWALLAQALVLLAFGSQGMALPFNWAATALLGYAALRSSGALSQHDAMPWGISLGLLASLLLVGCLIAAAPARAAGLLPSALVVGGIALASLMFSGGAPFQQTLDEVKAAPAALGGLLFGVVFPLLALGSLIQFDAAARASIPNFALPLPHQLVFFVLGLFSLLACTAGALRQHSLRGLLGWLAGAQVGLVVLALGLEGPLGRMAVHALLVNLALTTLAGALVVMMVERITGSDDFTLVVAGDKLRVPGIIWGLAALSALGVPSSWGFWGRSWLFHAASEQAPWVVPLVLGASVLLALAYLAPLARFRGGDVRGQSPAEESTRTGSGLLVPVLLAGALLVLTGLVPQALWEAGLSGIPGAPRSLPVTGEQHALTVVLALASGVAALLWLRLPPRPTLHDEDMTPVVLAPDGLGHQLGALAFAARPIPAGHGIWQGMLALGNVVRRAMVLFEKRYYLVGVLLAVLSLILVMAQG